MVDQRHVLIIVQNLPVPLDRRVWLECQALRERGYEVSVICPQGPGDPAYEVIDGVHIYKYRPAPQAEGLPGYAVEFGYSWLQTARLSVKVWRRQPFQVMQACNPPDTYWALARLWRSRGVRFVFDHHDLNPELFLSRFGQPKTRAQRLQYRGLLWLERMTFRTADRVTSTNESYKSVAVRRGDRRPEDVTVVRSCPDTRVMRPVYSELASRKPARFVLAYLGIMGPQDGVETVLDVMDELVHKRGREDVHAWLLGFGDCYDDLRRRCTELDLDKVVTFTGRADKGMIADHLSVADVGVGPDLKTPLNDLSTMNKTMEYMAYCLPCVSFDLVETRVTGGDAVLYAESGDVSGFADQVERLLDDDGLRLRLGLAGRRRVADDLDWSAQARGYVSVFDELTGTERTPEPPSEGALEELDPRGKRYVDLSDEAELGRFIVERSALPATPVAGSSAS
ncbi:glycosyltransferase family 4 protein [Intrasporangium sp.]|uniref:glycosyltransferase family 4 protein n=1 Tax=Intrasporangium sp. TaxID=1925024 RepID=UPI003221CCFF